MVKRNRSRERARTTDPVRRPPTAVTRIHTALEAEALAHWLLQPGRPWPVVVVSTAAEAAYPYVDVELLKSDVGDLAEVAVIPTGDVSWSFSSMMPSMTQVYGGASRVYSVDHDWVDDPHRSPLRFAYSTADDERVRAKLAHDALASAVRAGVVAAGPVPDAVAATGTVQGVVGSRAFVSLDDGTDATVWEELTAEGVPLDHVLAPGMQIHGRYDPGSRRFDLRSVLAESTPTSLDEIGEPGDLVLAQVVAVAGPSIALRPSPGLTISVPRELVTDNPLDDMTDLFTEGEVVVARVCDDGIGLRLDDIGELDAPANPAPSLLPGGPPWLTATPVARRASAPPEARASVEDRFATKNPETLQDATAQKAPTTRAIPLPGPRPSASSATPSLPSRTPEAPRPPSGPHPGPRRPTPRDLATHGPDSPALPSPPRKSPGPEKRRSDEEEKATQEAQHGALREVTLLLTTERARVTSLARELTVLAAMDRARAVELAELRRRAADLESALSTTTRQIEEQKTRYRRADRARQLAQKEIKSLRSSEGTRAAEHFGEQAFLDPAEQFRHEVYLEWTRRIPAAEKAAKPLAEYTVGETFLASLDALEGVSRAKVLRVVAEVLTGEARHIPGREVHRLRRGAGGDDPYITRAEDNAQAWRTALQRNTPGARRLHYWQLPGGTFELSRIVLHDDMEP